MNCPANVYTKVSFSCSLTVVSSGRNFAIYIDFGDGTNKTVNMKDSSLTITKTNGYLTSNIYVLQASVASNNLSVNPSINGR